MPPQTILYQEPPLLPERPPTEPTPSRSRQPTMKTTSSARTPQLRLTLRDVAVLEDLYTSRYMTAPQIQALHWRENRGGQFGQLKACQRRLRLMHDAGLVRRIEPFIHYTEGKKPLIYALDKAGAQV